MTSRQRGQTNLTAVLVVIGLMVAAVWGWKRLAPDTQDYLLEQAVPAALISLAVVTLLGMVIRRIRHRRAKRQRRNRLIIRFENETAFEKRRDLAFALIEANDYQHAGLEPVAHAMADVLSATIRTARGDKQHRLRGMAASYLGVLQDRSVVPLLLKALDDDHAHVRACAALGLGRLKAAEAKPKLEYVMKEDWDQTVRSRAREALERLA